MFSMKHHEKAHCSLVTDIWNSNLYFNILVHLIKCGWNMKRFWCVAFNIIRFCLKFHCKCFHTLHWISINRFNTILFLELFNHISNYFHHVNVFTSTKNKKFKILASANKKSRTTQISVLNSIEILLSIEFHTSFIN